MMNTTFPPDPTDFMMSPDEIRIRALVANVTNETHLLRNIPKGQEFHGLYPERIGADEFHTQEFRDKMKAWPDVFDTVLRHGLMMKPEYMLCPFGIKNDSGFRYVAEMMNIEDGKEIYGLSNPQEGIINLTEIAAFGNLKITSSGVVVTGLKFIGNHIGKVMEEYMWCGVVVIKPSCVGIINKKLGIIQDCKITSFYFKPNAVNPQG